MIHRPLGNMEYTYWMMGLASSTNFVVTCRLTGAIPHDALSGALSIIQRTYPLLNVHITADKRYGAVFKTCPDTSIPLAIEHLPGDFFPTSADLSFDTPLIRRIETEQLFDFSATRTPLMRCLLLRHTEDNATLVLTFHHAIADALSAVTVLQNIITATAEIINGHQPETPATPDPGPLERYIPAHYCGIGAFGKLSLHSLRQTMSRLSGSTKHIPATAKVWPDERRDRFIMSVLDEHRTDALSTVTRKHRCSIHAALCAAQLLALKEEHPSKPLIRAWLLSLVDLRRRFVPPAAPTSLSLTISMIESLFTVTETTSLWELAAAVDRRNRALIRKGFHFSFFPAMTRIIHAGHRFRTADAAGSRRMLRQGQLTRPPVLSVSNIGRISMPPDFGPLNCADVNFFLPLSSSGLFGSAITIFNGRLHWNFSYADPALAQERAVHLARRSVEILTQNNYKVKASRV